MGTYFQTRRFGQSSFTEIAAVPFTIVDPITALAVPLIGAIYDSTHSCRITFVLMAATPVVAYVVWMLLPGYRCSANIRRTPAVQSGKDL